MSLEEAFRKIAMRDVNGLILPKYGFKIEDLNDIINLEIKDGDVFVVTYPKCGTTWTQYIVWEIIHKGKTPPDMVDMLEKYFPFLEMVGIEPAEVLASPRTMKIHTPFNYSPVSSKAKYIVVIRNPFDCCVSFFHHLKNHEGLFLTRDLIFDDFFELFMNGHVPYGDYFDFVKSWYEHKDDENVFIMFFEQMKANFDQELTKLVEFLGEEYLEAVKDEQVLENIKHYSSFEYMKGNLHWIIPESIEPDANLVEVEFIRKGKTGDWKNFMSEEQKDRLLEKCEQEMGHTEIIDFIIPKFVKE